MWVHPSALPARTLHTTALSLRLDLEQLYLKDKSRPARDLGRTSAVTIAFRGGDDQLALFANAHAQQAFVPALNDLSSAQCEVERRVTVKAAVELAAVLVQRPGIVL